MGVGTPARVVALLDSGTLSSIYTGSGLTGPLGALESSSVERVIVDCSHVDSKLRGILDIGEVQRPLMQLLNRSEFKGRYGIGDGKVELFFF